MRRRELRDIIDMHDTLEEMGKDIVCQGTDRIQGIKVDISRMGNLLFQPSDLVHLREINLFSCKNLKKIPNLLGALNLETLDCEKCESLVELPSLARLTSLKTLRLRGCRSLKKFPEIPNNFDELDLSETGIKEVSDFIERLDRLQRLTLTNSTVKDVSSNISKLKSLSFLNLIGCPILKFPTLDVRLPSLRFKSLKYMHMDRCKSLKLLSELPPYLLDLNVHDCRSLEKVSFADQNLYQFDYLDADDTCFTMLFCNCFKLNQESINNIEANAMLKIGSLAKKWAARYDRQSNPDGAPRLICYFPGNKISANMFKCQSMNSSLSLKIAPNGDSGSRFLVFAICLVADPTHCLALHLGGCICEYQLTTAGGGNGGGGCENFRSEISLLSFFKRVKYMDYHVFILSSIDMVIEDKNYEEASFKFYIRPLGLGRGGEEYIKVERCGVHVFYVDKKSDSDATEKRVAGNKRSFSHDGEEGDGGLKRLK
ncbi:inactive disease resistance protein RPS4-like [Gossypium hirsutum]|uniref:Inactive disease resistance protein RPS4-like n=1 Tax=Gossypium hirsutum TaxID=3635 RepID=A0A1U8MBK8_GOSHI|nr:inactive disease resistance protein RPS4-like [Gossypium hirsutum]